jgi:archaellum component FlaC
MQNNVTQVQTPPAPPAPPAPPGTGIIRLPDGQQITLGPSAANLQRVPQTRAEVQALKARRSEISNQLESAAGRRKSLATQLEQAKTEVSASGLAERVKVLDARIVQLENDLATSGQLLAAAPAQALSGTSQASSGGPADMAGLDDGAVVAISVVFTLAVLMPLSITFARLIWRRASGAIMPQRSKEEIERLDRLEAAVETIAVEMERVSEGQRFVSRLLTEGRSQAPLFGQARQAEPVPAHRGSGDPDA